MTSCQAKSTPKPEIHKETTIIEQTVEVPKIVEQTVVVTELVEVIPVSDKTQKEKFELKPEHFDAILALYNHFNYLDRKDCEAYYESIRVNKRPANKDDALIYCPDKVGGVKVKLIRPGNYQYFGNCSAQRTPPGCEICVNPVKSPPTGRFGLRQPPLG
jgi:hypothetical protein